MRIRPLPADEDAVRRFVEALWIPYHRELEATVAAHELADDVDLVAEELEYRLDQLEETTHRTWVAVDAPADGSTDGAFGDGGDLAGFVTADREASPSVFDRPDRIVVGDLYVRKPYRGSGLARDLLARVAELARTTDRPELLLDVDADNERAIAFYEKQGFEPHRHRMVAAVDDLSAEN